MLKPFNRRYIGNKNKLNGAIRSFLKKAKGDSFLDIFAGTASVSYNNLDLYKEVGLNDNLFHNFVIYNAFFSNKKVNKEKIKKFLKTMNELKFVKNIFSELYGDKFFTTKSASKIWEARKFVEKNKKQLNTREYYILISSIIFAADKASRSVGHFESFLRSGKHKEVFFDKLDIKYFSQKFNITNIDSNQLSSKQKIYNVVYIDPPYNSRQYAYFYHVLETIALFELSSSNTVVGVAAKPDYIYKKSSEYSKSNALFYFKDLIKNLNCDYLIVSYNNTFNPKSSSSRNKIEFEDIKNTLSKKGTVKVKEIKYRHFNAGKTNLKNHKEYLFFVEVYHD